VSGKDDKFLVFRADRSKIPETIYAEPSCYLLPMQYLYWSRSLLWYHVDSQCSWLMHSHNFISSLLIELTA